MKIFFPGLLLLVALMSFMVFTGMLYRSLPKLSYYVFDDSTHGSFNYANSILWHVSPLLIGMMLSVWVANWAWKEIQRVKVGRIE